MPSSPIPTPTPAHAAPERPAAVAVASSRPARRRALWRGALQGAAGALASTAVLLWRGRVEGPSAAAMLNASSQWLHGAEALRHPEPNLRHTLTGSVIHHGAALLWGLVFEALQLRRAQPAAVGSLARDAAAVAAAAALVDLRLVPPRLGPGFDRHLSRAGTALVYAGFGAGLALAGWCLHARRPR